MQFYRFESFDLGFDFLVHQCVVVTKNDLKKIRKEKRESACPNGKNCKSERKGAVPSSKDLFFLKIDSRSFDGLAKGTEATAVACLIELIGLNGAGLSFLVNVRNEGNVVI